ncbi:MAG: lipoyl(octanoyl) transferase LipB [Hyphomicrobiaceae bacterium]|nr:lipoyl(octanoyl) transferase LipB [Hyphomicrobiaceae bacterium]MCC0023635.1 lipoyl(octanoyl) transferase LipB [Hyphomicrobiaceae bacterium]
MPEQTPTFYRQDRMPVGWSIANGLVGYGEAEKAMKERAASIARGSIGETVWLLEHPPLFTAGTSAKPDDLLQKDRFPVFQSGRGGQFTYHGPGQRVAYVMLNLRQRERDIRKFVQTLESWVIGTLARFNIAGYTVPGRVGVWVKRPDKGILAEDKIAAIGVRVSKWVSYHGISLNVSPDLENYDGIVPCGITDQGVTSFEDLGQLVSLAEVDMALRQSFEEHFGPTADAAFPDLTGIEAATLA